jgi:hypothetical protein
LWYYLGMNEETGFGTEMADVTVEDAISALHVENQLLKAELESIRVILLGQEQLKPMATKPSVVTVGGVEVKLPPLTVASFLEATKSLPPIVFGFLTASLKNTEESQEGSAEILEAVRVQSMKWIVEFMAAGLISSEGIDPGAMSVPEAMRIFEEVTRRNELGVQVGEWFRRLGEGDTANTA